MMWWLLGAEGVIALGSYLEARVRQREWFYRWMWWHLVAMWFGWFGAVRLMLLVCNQRSTVRHGVPSSAIGGTLVQLRPVCQANRTQDPLERYLLLLPP